MKTVIFANILLLTTFLFSPSAKGQLKSNAVQRCATMERLRLHEANYLLTRVSGSNRVNAAADDRSAGNFRLQNVVTIPVVVHIVLSNPFLITDADVQEQLDLLNKDFAGINADSTNGTSFYTVRGHGRIQFALARRTPSGQLTNGIERRASNAGANVNETADPIKRSVLGGLDAWNPNDYLNLWIGNDASGAGILGYADNIGPGSSLDDGVFINYKSFGSSSCYTLSKYARGRTATHEIGHYFGLYHIWGDDNGCTGDDFKQLPASTNYALPEGLYNPDGQGNGTLDVGDTPNQAGETASCPSGNVVDACANTGAGKMYQNFMDYTQDACLSMFTSKQAARMEWVLENCRPGLKSSQGAVPPTGAVSLDAALYAPVSPGGFEMAGCSTVYYSDTFSCPGTVAPKFRVVNNGLQTITNLTVGYSIDGGANVVQTVAVSIPQGGYYVASFPSIAATLGTHSLRFYVASPNGGADEVPSNDTYTQRFTVLAPTTAPLTEDFEAALPNTTWTIDNYDQDFTWHRTAPGKNGSAGKLSINNYEEDGSKHRDDFRSATIVVDPQQKYTLSFDLAHKSYPDAQYADTLSILVSKDCGQTFTRIYSKSGLALATAGSSGDSYDKPAEGDWRTETVSLGSDLLSAGKIILVFRNSSGYGNWVHLDNIALQVGGAGDLQLVSVKEPKKFVCATYVTPSVVVRNVGDDTVRSFKLVYTINNGINLSQNVTGLTLGKGGETSVSLPAINNLTPGRFNLRIFSTELVTSRGSGDANAKNDTLQFSFSVPGAVRAPLAESFSASLFPPPDWSVIDGGSAYNWQHFDGGNGNDGSAFLNTYRNTETGQQHTLALPSIEFEKVDSVKLSFDLVAARRDRGNGLSASDTLEVLLTKDCGNTFTTLYRKWGAALQTGDNALQGAEFFPQAGNWRRETVDLSAFAEQSPVTVFFRATNGNGNNIFIDNVSFKTQILPARLKAQGYLFYPVPFRSSFTVWHYQPPTTLHYIRVINVAGQTVWTKTFTGNAEKQEPVNLSNQAPGVYIVELGYQDGTKRVAQKVIKE